MSTAQQDIEQRVQAASLQQTAATMSSLTETVRNNTASAGQAEELARAASDVALRGGREVADVVSTMTGISDSAAQISEIIGVIDGIAFQTNILALNAGVEARVQSSKEKVSRLLQAKYAVWRSAAAAKEIKERIGNSVSRAAAGTSLVERAGATVVEVVGSIQRVQQIVGEISDASRIQFTGIEEVNQAVRQIDEVAQQNAALVEEAAAAASSLEDQSVKLTATVRIFCIEAVS